MTGVNSARLWMLLQSERSLGLEAVPWKLASVTRLAARVLTRSAEPPPAPRYNAPPRQTPAPAIPRPIPAARRDAEAPVERAPLLSAPVHPAVVRVRPELTDAPPVPPEAKSAALAELHDNVVKGCTKCRLCEGRTQTVFGEGSANAQLMFIGEGPGESEDQSGRPFVGRAGQLLTKMIGAMGLAREDVYIANVVKCRPPENRTPLADEVAACTPFLLRQIEIIRPRVIVTLGLPASQFLLATDRPMGDLRGRWHDWFGIKIMPTYHPAYVLRSYTPQVRGKVWSDLQMVMKELGLEAKGSSEA